MLKYEIATNDAKTVIVLEGDMDIDATELMEGEIEHALSDCRNIEMDFAKVLFVDSSGIGLLITLIGRIRDAGSRVVIKCLSPDVMQIFSMLQLPEILGRDVFADL